MNLRTLTFATSASLLTLAGCATQQTGADPAEALNKRLSSIESRLQAEAGSTQGSIGEFGKKVEALSGELRRLQESVASQASQQSTLAEKTSSIATAQQTTDSAMVARLNDYEARLAALGKRMEEVARMAQEAYDATGLGQRKIFGKVIEFITLTEDKTLFPINSPTLGEQDKAKLDALAIRLKDLGTNYHLSIQGHTEGFGSDDYNYQLGKARAEAVKNYLNEKGGIPLLRMSVISYGSLEAAGYAAKSNRRIVVQVLQ